MLNKVFSAMAVCTCHLSPNPLSSILFLNSFALKIISNVFRKYTEYLY
jgi:hypothetical protein